MTGQIKKQKEKEGPQKGWLVKQKGILRPILKALMEGAVLRWRDREFQKRAKRMIPHGLETHGDYVEQCGLVGMERAWGLVDGDEVTEVGGAVTIKGFLGQEDDL